MYKQAIIITLFNPKAIFFFMVFYPMFIKSVQHGLWLVYVLMTLILMAVNAIYLSSLSFVSSKLVLIFRHSRTLQMVVRLLCGCVFIFFGLRVAVLK